MNKKTLLLVVAASLLGAGCGNESMRSFDASYAHPTTVKKQTALLTIRSLSNGQVSQEDSKNINEFVYTYQRQGEAPIAISIGGNNGRDPHVADRASILAQELTKRGISRKDLAFYVAPGEPPSLAQMSFSVYSVAPEECGHWEKSSEFDLDNHISSNFGCATQHNVDAMVANPADLYHPRAVANRDANRSFDIVSAYWVGEEIPSSEDLLDVTITGTSGKK